MQNRNRNPQEAAPVCEAAGARKYITGNASRAVRELANVINPIVRSRAVSPVIAVRVRSQRGRRRIGITLLLPAVIRQPHRIHRCLLVGTRRHRQLSPFRAAQQAAEWENACAEGFSSFRHATLQFKIELRGPAANALEGMGIAVSVHPRHQRLVVGVAQNINPASRGESAQISKQPGLGSRLIPI
ncbi:hypothetical protein SB861_50065 [Paraburkholderia sp. SIMBA_049]